MGMSHLKIEMTLCNELKLDVCFFTGEGNLGTDS